MTNNKKSLATIKVVDVFGYAIPKAQYEVKNQKTGQLIASGSTNSAGCIVEISRDKGTILDIYVKSMFNGLMLNVKSFTMSKDRMLVKITSPKVLLDLKTLINQGNAGQYKRKTHVVKKDETLTSIASQKGTTVRALEMLNNIDDPDKISIGQVIKLPVNIPATGNNAHHDKPKPIATSQPKPAKTKTSKPQATQPPQKEPSILDSAKAWGLEQAHNLYENGVKVWNEANSSKIPTTDDRSQDGGTPKANVPNLCKTTPQCISSGKSELIREVNIRLAGFGGALPTDEFTELTAKCIRQFQQDYMGVPPTGKICGSLIVSLDKFRDEYGITNFFDSMKCPCGKCSGFGKGRSGTFTFESYVKKTKSYILVQRTLIEPAGMHRSLIWGLKAMIFYFDKMENPKGYNIVGISSGYRCVDNNLKKRRATTNHMGTALDLTIVNNKKQTIKNNELENDVRKEWFCKYLNATLGWSANRFGLERLSDDANTWVHLDVREYSNEYKMAKLFSNTKDGINGDYLLNLLRQDKKASLILGCAGIASVTAKNPILSDSSLEDLIKQLGNVIAHGEGNYESYNTGTKNVKNDKVGFSFRNPSKGTVTSKTIKQIIANAKAKDGNDKDRLFATGKYQTTYYTLQAGIDKRCFTGAEIYDVSMQEKVFREFLISKRSTLYEFVRNGKGNIIDAQYDAAQEWASVAVPKGKPIGSGAISNGKKSYYEKKGQNSSSEESTKMVIEILTKIQSYHVNRKKV